MRELQDAMERYGEVTIKHYRFIHAFGDDIVRRLPVYLGEGSQVLGVPPAGQFSVDGGDYRDAKFSACSADILTLSPVQMGVALGIPHTHTAGMTWLRIVIEFEMSGGAIKVTVGDGPAALRSVPLPHTAEDVENACKASHEYAQSMLDNPVRAATAIGLGRFGFT